MGDLAAAVDRCDFVVKFGTDGCEAVLSRRIAQKIDAQLLIDVK